MGRIEVGELKMLTWWSNSGVGLLREGVPACMGLWVGEGERV